MSDGQCVSLSTSSILGLLYTAPERFSGFQALLHRWTEPERAAIAERDWLAAEPHSSAATLTQREGESRPRQSAIVDETVHVRVRKSSPREFCADVATAGPSDAGSILAGIGTLGCRRMLQPFDLIPHMVISVIGETTIAQRQAIRVKATPRRQESDVADPTVWTGVDEYEFLIDAERGIILGLTAFHKGKAFAGEEFLRVKFTSPLPQRTARWGRIANIVGLLYNAQYNFSTVRGAMRWWYQTEEKKRRGWLWRLEKTGRFLTTDHIVRFWADNPSRFRGEVTSDYNHRTSVFVVNGNVWWDSLSSKSVTTNTRREQVADSANVSVLEEVVGGVYEDAEYAIISQIPLNPSWLVSGLWIEPMGRTRYLAREVIVVRGEPIERDTDWYWWDGADEYQLLIDADRGLLLRIGVFRNGKEFAGAEVTSLELDQPIPDEVFTFTLSSGMQVRVNPSP